MQMPAVLSAVAVAQGALQRRAEKPRREQEYEEYRERQRRLQRDRPHILKARADKRSERRLRHHHEQAGKRPERRKEEYPAEGVDELLRERRGGAAEAHAFVLTLAYDEHGRLFGYHAPEQRHCRNDRVFYEAEDQQDKDRHKAEDVDDALHDGAPRLTREAGGYAYGYADDGGYNERAYRVYGRAPHGVGHLRKQVAAQHIRAEDVALLAGSEQGVRGHHDVRILAAEQRHDEREDKHEDEYRREDNDEDAAGFTLSLRRSGETLALEAEAARGRNYIKYRAEKAILFGSYARQEARSDSDIDLMVVGGKDFVPTDIFCMAEELHHASGKPVNVYERCEIEDGSDLLKIISQEGIVIQ